MVLRNDQILEQGNKERGTLDYEGLVTSDTQRLAGGLAPLFDLDVDVDHDVEHEGAGAAFSSQAARDWYKEFWGQSAYTLGLFGLGDVGGSLGIALRTLGSDGIKALNIFDLSDAMAKRYHLELNQIYCEAVEPIPVKQVKRDDLYASDVLIFTASKGVPPVGTAVSDVRMAQLKSNAQLVADFVTEAEERGFKGLYVIVSDPVDLLCQCAKDTLIQLGCGAARIRVKGFGLGVMYARARYYAQSLGYVEFLERGRAFGPHGKDLVILNNIGDGFDLEVSLAIKNLTVGANLVVRELGFKPYIAPAISSGAYAIKAMLEGKYHYSTIPFGQQYLGIRNRFSKQGIMIETMPYKGEVASLLLNTLEAMEGDYATLSTV